MTCLRLQYHGTCYSKLDSTLLRVEYVHLCVYGTKSSLSFFVSLASCLDMAGRRPPGFIAQTSRCHVLACSNTQNRSMNE